MAVQNPYNNYMGRMNKKPTNNFKEKIKNSLGGVATQNTQGTSASTPIVTTPPANNNATPYITTPPVSDSKPVTPTPQVNTPITPATASTPTPEAPVTTPAPTGDTSIGLMSLEDINGSYTTPQATPVTSDEVTALASNPEIQRQAYSNGKTPQQMAQELLEEQKKQLQADWEIKQQEIKLQQEQANNSFNQSKTDAESSYNESIDKINQDRYNRQQDLNVSGTKRGIQYSPQQLGLETVANINTNKNVTEAGKQRNELLNKLQQQLNEINANLLLGSQQSMNDYNKALAQLNSDYANKIMDWTYNDNKTDEDRKWQESQTESDRKWQEQQTQLDREWQEKMDNANKQWQSSENALDREKSGSGRSSYSSGYSSSYKPYSRSRSYGGYSNYSSSGMNGYDDSAFDLSDEVNSLAYEKTFKEMSEDSMSAYSDMRTQPYNEKLRSQLYTDDMKGYIDYAKENGMSTVGLRNLTKDYDANQNKLYETFGLNKKDSMLKQGNGRLEHALNTNLTRYAPTEGRMRSLLNSNKAIEDGTYKKPQYGSDVKNTTTVKPKTNVKASTNQKATNPKEATKDKVTKSLNNAKQNSTKASENAKKNAKTSTTKAKENIKKSTSNAKDNVKKSVTKSKENTKKSTSKAKENIKKNIKKLFKKK